MGKGGYYLTQETEVCLREFNCMSKIQRRLEIFSFAGVALYVISFGGSQKGDLVWLLEGGNCQNNISLCGRGLPWWEMLVCQISVWGSWPWGLEPFNEMFLLSSLVSLLYLLLL